MSRPILWRCAEMKLKYGIISLLLILRALATNDGAATPSLTAGRKNVRVVPCPGSECASIWPWWFLTIKYAAGKAEAGSAGPGREKRVEYPVQVVRRDADALVGYRYFDVLTVLQYAVVVLLDQGVFRGDGDGAAAGHGLYGIADDVLHDLRDLRLVGFDRPDSRRSRRSA